MQTVSLYSGPEYRLDSKYSHILTLIYVAFMYGLFIPILFPIAALGIFIMYLTEKLAILYFYQKPPMYDDSLSKHALRYLQLAPVPMFVMSYWAFGNSAIFFNDKDLKKNNNAVQNPHHGLLSTSGQLDQTHMILFGLFLFFLCRNKCLKKPKNKSPG